MTFKRGDWVTWNHGNPDCIHQHCLFIKHIEGVPGLATIDEDGKGLTVHLKHLEPGENPNG